MSLSKMGEFLKKEGMLLKTARPDQYLDTGYPPLNNIISGNYDLGFKTGQIVMIAGASASGKTMIATQLMISTQKQKGYAAFFDHEGAFAEKLAIKHGLDVTDENSYLYVEGKTFEQTIKQAINLGRYIRENEVVSKDAPVTFIFDSLAAMTPQAKVAKGVDELTMNDSTMLARTTSQIFPAIAQIFKELNITAVFINQLRDSLKTTGGPGGAPIPVFPGGKSPYYYSSTILVLSGSKLWSNDKTKLIGHTVTCRTEKSRNTRPHQKVEWNFMFNSDGSGEFDAIGSYANYLKEKGIIKSAGPRVEWDGGKPFMSQVITELKAMPNGLEFLRKLHLDSEKAKHEVEEPEKVKGLGSL